MTPDRQPWRPSTQPKIGEEVALEFIREWGDKVIQHYMWYDRHPKSRLRRQLQPRRKNFLALCQVAWDASREVMAIVEAFAKEKEK